MRARRRSPAFQSTPPRRGRPSRAAALGSACHRFNPRPREGGDLRSLRSCAVACMVSIHAPAKGATLPTRRSLDVAHVFQSTPPRRGRRPIASMHRRRRSCFNPRPREGGDRSHRRRSCRRRRVSIHAPAKGATDGMSVDAHPTCSFQSTPPRRGRPSAPIAAASTVRCFNPRPREGGDALRSRAAMPACMFQSTPPRRGRHDAPIGIRSADACFNPRPREGGDCDRRRRAWPIAMFQSTPPRRGRPACTAADWHARRVSIHAPAKGATPPPIALFCLQRNPVCPCEMVTSAGTSEPFGAENFGKPHDLNRLNEVRTFRGSRARLRFALATTSNDQRAAEIDGRLGADMLDPPAPIRPRPFLQNNSTTSTNSGRSSWSTVIS